MVELKHDDVTSVDVEAASSTCSIVKLRVELVTLTVPTSLHQQKYQKLSRSICVDGGVNNIEELLDAAISMPV